MRSKQKRDDDAALQATLRKLMRAAHPTPNVCGQMDEAEEASTYERLLLGHGCLYFMATTAASSHPYYGVGLRALRSPQFVERWHGPASPTHGFSIDTRAFLTQLCTDAERVHLGDTTAPRLWPPVPGAREAVEWYDAMQANLATHRRCLRPPPKTHATLEAIVRQRWCPITDADVRAWQSSSSEEEEEEEEEDAPFFFSIAQTHASDPEQVRRAFGRRWPQARLQSLPFMGSRLFRLQPHSAPHHP
jgi:hypothetical protein